MPACKQCGAKVTRAGPRSKAALRTGAKGGHLNEPDPLTNHVVNLCDYCFEERRGRRP